MRYDMRGYVRLGLRVPPEINEALKNAARLDYMTKNQKAIEIFKVWIKQNVNKPTS